MKQLTVGILAHVDAGKTTLSEALLYAAGKIASPGRVDNRDAYLDTYDLERARGITIFSKQAVFDRGDVRFTLLDTPGHVDFSAEMERTLQVLDYAILVISGADGVQVHTRTLWQLLERYGIPAFLFVNKMDQPGTDRGRLLMALKRQLDDGCIAFDHAVMAEAGGVAGGNAPNVGKTAGAAAGEHAFYDQIAMCGEALLDEYLETGAIGLDSIQTAIWERTVFPCYFGSALRLDGVDKFLDLFASHVLIPIRPQAFGAKVFKITRDDQGNRLTHLKVTGGLLKVRDPIRHADWEEKITAIRVYSGDKFALLNEVAAGTVCAVTGLTQTKSGEGLGDEEASEIPMLEPVLSYRLQFPDGTDPRLMLPKLRLLEEEEPELHIDWNETLQEIHARLMGEVQMEILQSIIRERFDADVVFDAGQVLYKETIQTVVEGVGHFEPLRHYAEVHLLLEPGEPGSGLQFGSACSEDLLAKNWQHLVLTHLEEKRHVGVLTGSEITDMRITLVSGKAHNKHTEGGDFRQATYRAVRQGLMEAESVLLEPWYAFTLELPEKMVGRAMHDVEGMHGTCEIARTDGDRVVLAGSAPVVTMKNYQQAVVAYTRGLGRLSLRSGGFAPCHNAEEVIAASGYDSDLDMVNPTGSVFCAHGTGFLVEWCDVKEHMHLEAFLRPERPAATTDIPAATAGTKSRQLSLEEIHNILESAHYGNRGKRSTWKRRGAREERRFESSAYVGRRKETDEEYLLVDGYNIIHAWPELKNLAEANLDSARSHLLDILSNYQGIRKCHIIAVFDAYNVPGRREESTAFHNIHVVFTREAQTADQYIERFAHVNKDKYHITVATSDGLQQLIVRSAGSALLSARELKVVIDEANEQLKQTVAARQDLTHTRLRDTLSSEEKARMNDAAGNISEESHAKSTES